MIHYSRSHFLPNFLIGTTAIAAIVSFNSVAIAAKSPQEIAKLANTITVQVNPSTPGRGSGSGIIIAKEGNTYTVLTCDHVKRDVGDSPTIRTYDGKSYPITSAKSLGSSLDEKSVDLAIITFTASAGYPTATLGDSEQTSLGAQIFVFGYPVQGIGSDRKVGENRDSEFSPGFVTSRRTNAKYGYSVRYNAITLGGMSGGPVLDTEGRVVGIHGLGDADVGRGTTESGQEVSVRMKTGFNSAIPVSSFLAMRSQLGEVAKKIAVNNTATSDTPATRLSNPQSTSDFVVAGLVQSDKGNSTGAISSYTQAISLDAKNAEAYYQRANARYNQGDNAGALTDYTQALSLNANYADAFYNRAVIRLNTNDNKGAIEDLTEAIRLNPNDVVAYYNRAAARSRVKDVQGTIEDFTEVIRLKPDHTTAYMERARFRNSSGDKAGAIEDFTAALNLNLSTLNQGIAHYNRGILRRNFGDLNGAISDLESAAPFFQQEGQKAFYEKAMDELKWLTRDRDRANQNTPSATNREVQPQESVSTPPSNLGGLD